MHVRMTRTGARAALMPSCARYRAQAPRILRGDDTSTCAVRNSNELYFILDSSKIIYQLSHQIESLSSKPKSNLILLLIGISNKLLVIFKSDMIYKLVSIDLIPYVTSSLN